ncbi:protein FAR1-RELATED SEQUENCE 6-like [Panicum miliaceum]|uniref:Protein FAR1-RELATED SEQUENCE 6-like n=1 Tax=Panicum miliaceum TaxID=4540 RepID=A0A3L6RRB5_PANMI|nr:protein FAR1-RELATED SEQUENCE 6-like [Panicum miliaceum]
MRLIVGDLTTLAGNGKQQGDASSREAVSLKECSYMEDVKDTESRTYEVYFCKEEKAEIECSLCIFAMYEQTKKQPHGFANQWVYQYHPMLQAGNFLQNCLFLKLVSLSPYKGASGQICSVLSFVVA